MAINQVDHVDDSRHRQSLIAAGGLLGALAAFQPYFITATLGFLGYGYWLVYRSSTRACTNGETCARPLSSRIVKTSLILATILVVAALGLDFIAPLFLNS